MTTTEDCQRFTDLDRTFGTDPRSPLHHDNRCPIHNDTARIRAERLMLSQHLEGKLFS